MTSLWFIVPARGRVELAAVCLRQLARTCETLTENGIPASAVIVADDENLEIAADLGFATVERENKPLGRKINDGFELAGRAGVTHMAALGNDDWIDPAFVLSAPLPDPGQIRCCRLTAIVREDGRRMASLRIPYEGGDGVRIYPRELLAPCGFRPSIEDAPRALDTRSLQTVQRRSAARIVYHDLHPWQIVDWKSGTQLNSYRDCLTYQEGAEVKDPFAVVAAHYPSEAIDEMAALYGIAVAA